MLSAVFDNNTRAWRAATAEDIAAFKEPDAAEMARREAVYAEQAALDHEWFCYDNRAENKRAIADAAAWEAERPARRAAHEKYIAAMLEMAREKSPEEIAAEEAAIDKAAADADSALEVAFRTAQRTARERPNWESDPTIQILISTDEIPDVEAASWFVDWVNVQVEMDDVQEQVLARARGLGDTVMHNLSQRSAADYVRDIRGNVENNNVDNVAFFLRSISCELRFDAWRERVDIRGGDWKDWTYVDDGVMAQLRMRASRTHTRFCPSKDFLWDAVVSIAHAHTVDPAGDELARLQAVWDGKPRLATWLTTACGVSDDAYHQAVGQNMVGGMVRRIRQPGCKHDQITVLIGAQGTGKSRLCAALAPRSDWYAESIRLGDEAKELVLSLAGKCIAEISEMSTSTRDVNAIKAMVSRRTDAGRTAYARSVTERLRRNIFVATTNDSTPLVDDTGNRRFLPVHIAREIDIAWVEQNRDQLLGEAAHLKSQGHDFSMPRDVWSFASAQQEAARVRPEFEIYFTDWFAPGPLGMFVTASDLSEFAKAAAGHSVSASRYTKSMRDLGFVKGTKRVEGRPVAVWHRGDLSTATRAVPQHDRGRTIVRLQIQAAPPVAIVAPPPPLPVV